MKKTLPFELREAVVSVCGKAFWLKDPFRSFLLSCNVPEEVYERYSDESKFKIARHILAELDRMDDEGYEIQRRIITELCKLKNVPDPNVPDNNAALDALRWLKQLAVEHDISVESQKVTAETKMNEARKKQNALSARASKMEQLRNDFNGMISAKTQDEVQRRGYDLEELLAQIFEVHEINYRRSYRVGNEQIDGHFSYRGFDYLVEAKWRSEQPTESDLAIFKRKADKKLTSTRGWYVSIGGYKQQVILEFTRSVSSNIVLMDGQDLALILEGQVSLLDALELKTQKAAQEGIIFFPLSQRFSG
jgi:hypothetical protein